MRFFPILLLLVGCGGYDPVSDNHGYGYAYDVQGASGLKLRFNAAEPVDQRTPVWVFENFWMDVQKCAGLTATPPMVIVVAQGSLPAGKDGFYYSGPPLIAVTSLSMFKHEAVHYLLESNTGNLDTGHVSPLFVKCS